MAEAPTRCGFVAILGAPNVGKSSLLNWLAKREAAIVSTVAGTTRDVIEVDLDLGGYPVALADTAGLRDSSDPVEGEGIRRAKARAAAADLKLVLFDASAPPDPESLALLDERSVVLATKSDLEWTPPVETYCAASFDVARGDLLVLRATGTLSGAICLEDDDFDTAAFDPEVPAEGAGFCYLVRASLGTWSGTGVDERGNRNATLTACP